MPKPWRWHNKVKRKLDKSIPSEEDILEKINSISNARNRYFIMMLYYTGGRISEVLNVQRISKEVRYSRMLSKYVPVIEIHMPNEKTRDKIPTKIIPLNLEIENIEYILPMYEYVKMVIRSPQKWGFSTKQRAWQIIKKETEGWFDFPVNPHIFRHLRTSHLTMRGYHPEVIRRLLGWTSLRMYERHYSHLNVSDLI